MADSTRKWITEYLKTPYSPTKVSEMLTALQEETKLLAQDLDLLRSQVQKHYEQPSGSMPHVTLDNKCLIESCTLVCEQNKSFCYRHVDTSAEPQKFIWMTQPVFLSCPPKRSWLAIPHNK